MKKWDWYKDNEIGPKINSALQSKVLSEEQAEMIWAEIEEREEMQRKS